MPDAQSLLGTAYRDLSAVLSSLTTEEGWEPTGCAGWTAVDLGFHLLSDARRALVALHTPAAGPADTYWRSWRPPAPGDDDELLSTRIVASAHGGLGPIAARYAEATAAVLVAAALLQGPVPSVRGAGGRRVLLLLSTLTVEAAVHHLDLVVRLRRPGPAAAPLAEVRRVLAGLLGASLPEGWDDVTAARRGTGREALTDTDRVVLGASADRFPLFG